MRFVPALLALLPACAPIPNVPRAAADMLAPPELVPVADLLEAGDDLAAMASPAPGLSAQAEALARRAAGIPAPGGGTVGPADTPEPGRAAALVARAAALRAPVLTDDERARLGQGTPEPPSLQ